MMNDEAIINTSFFGDDGNDVFENDDDGDDDDDDDDDNDDDYGDYNMASKNCVILLIFMITGDSLPKLARTVYILYGWKIRNS